MELLDERWTMLVVRELVTGSHRFNDLRRGLPKMSPTLLSKRLSQLARAGLIKRQVDGNEVQYLLTPAGEELRPVVEALGAWGVRWIGHLGEEDLDPSLLLWDMRRNVDHAALPSGRTVAHFQFPDVSARSRRWWLVITVDDADVCDTDPGYDVNLTVTVDLQCMTRIWRGDLSWSDALRSGSIVLDGPNALRRALPNWFTPPRFASVPRAPQYLPAPHETDSPPSMA
jgi:DNA-binding HxlR family transcriptional regulator